MKKWMLLLAGGLASIGLSAMAALAQPPTPPMIVTSPTGTLRVQQDVPCGDNVDLTVPITGGRLEITPAEGVDAGGDKIFALTRLNLSFGSFSVHRDCLGFGETRNYTEESAELGRAVSFTASPSSPGVYAFTIRKEDFQIYQAAIVNGTFDAGYKRPSGDVTGTIDFNLGTVKMTAVVATRIHFKACFIVCPIDEDDDGTLTVNLSGPIVFPDADGDGIPDRSDNCRFVANFDQHTVPTPVVTPPFDLTLASCTDHRIGRAVAADVCDGGPVIVTNNAPARFATGSNIVTWHGEDSHHRTATANQTVTVVDTTPPIFTFVPPHLDLNNCGSPPLGLPTAIDDCAGTVAFTNDAPSIFLVGTTVVTWTATDVSGNQTTATQTVTVVDTVPPTVSCAATNPTGSSFLVTAFDACSTPIIRLGSFVIANGETIKINETGQPGVRLVNDVSSDHIRHFQVGKGQGVITATDPSNNVGTAVCR